MLRKVDAIEEPAQVAPLVHVPRVLKDLGRKIVGRRHGVGAAGRCRHVD